MSWVYSQQYIVTSLIDELKVNYRLTRFSKLNIRVEDYESLLEKDVFLKQGAFYLITQTHGNWTTIIELNVNLDNSFYLYELVNSLSKRLDTYALSFHLHDDDVLYYNLERQGESLDGYNSDFQYFESKPMSISDILSQRHTPEIFSHILIKNKNTDELNSILNEGLWEAFDNNDLDENGLPIDDDKYYVDELDRHERVGKYLEIFSDDEYPFANWYVNLSKLNLKDCYLLKAET